MPIELNKDVDAKKLSKTITKTYSPKFFNSSILTGKGAINGKGLLTYERNPYFAENNHSAGSEFRYCKKRKYTNADRTIHEIPFSVILDSNLNQTYFTTRKIPADKMELIHIADLPKRKLSYDLYVRPFSAIYEETKAVKSTNTPAKKSFRVAYEMTLFIQDGGYNSSKDEFKEASSYTQDGYMRFITGNPTKIVEKIVKNLNMVGKHDNLILTDTDVDNIVSQIDLYDGICKQSKMWQCDIDKELDHYFKVMKDALLATTNTTKQTNIIKAVKENMRHIESYNVPLELYRNIYASLVQHFNKVDATAICKENLNLLLSDTLHNLDQNKKQLTQLPVNPKAKTDPKYSIEQQKAITTHEPLALVQAGAGTGKSTVVLARIQYMIDCGVDPNDIMVLSFTNAAANNIIHRNPNVHSMTIAKMIHLIYTENYKNHELSNIDTIMNSLSIYFPNDTLAIELRRRLFRIVKQDKDAFTQMNNFVEKNFDGVIQILDYIKQTSLELEIIICYHKIGSLKEPEAVKSKYLIIDEVQDNSIFEFVYTLKYIDKHKESLFMVGK